MRLLALLLPSFGMMLAAQAAVQPHALMPVPAELHAADGQLAITSEFTVAIDGHSDARLRAGLDRAVRRWEERTGFTFARPFGAAGNKSTLVIACGGSGNTLPTLGEDESYALDVTPTGATLRAPATVGVLRGLETLLQLLASDADGFHVPAVSVRDAPRFPWRGLLIDVCRHWQPMPVIKRTLDGMALVKLNVLHLHLTEDQGFRIESKTHPRLHELGSDGNFFTQNEIREIIAYAAERGIRVVPEFDIPGHATSWLVGHPEIASLPGPFQIERKWGVFDPTLDPTNEKTYELLEGFLGEMAALFPDPYLHIGGDENNGKQWDSNPRIQAFIREHNLKDNHGLQAHFNRRVLAILTKYKKRMIGWDEIFHPDLPKDAVIHSWRGAESLAEAARQGYQGILSSGYYIDLCHSARDHYLNDPLPADTKLTSEQQARVLGGEATMWAEWVTPETIDSRIWPRTAAIAERLWSPRDVRDVDDMYRRLDVVHDRLEELGLSLTRHVDFMLRRFTNRNLDPLDERFLREVAAILEPVKDYRRGGQQRSATQFTPLTGLADCLLPESGAAREFAALVHRSLSDKSDWSNISGFLFVSKGAASRLTGLNNSADPNRAAPRLLSLAPFFQRINDACDVGMDACQFLDDGKTPPVAWIESAQQKLSLVAAGYDGCELAIVPSIRLLVVAAAAQAERATMSPADWRKHVEKIAAALAAADAH